MGTSVRRVWQRFRWPTSTTRQRAGRIGKTGSPTRRRDRCRWPLGSDGGPIRRASQVFLRIDTVHRGDLEGIKGVYHIHAVDEVTQWQVVAATAQIREAWLIAVLDWLIAVLETMLRQFPFQIPRLPFRPWQPVHQSHGGPIAGEPAGGTDPIAASAF